MLLSPAQRPLATTSLVVRDEEALNPYIDGKRGLLGVPSACPIVRRLRATHDLMRYLPIARSSSLTQWLRQIKLVPKLTVRVRFLSPAPHAALRMYVRAGLEPDGAQRRPH